MDKKKVEMFTSEDVIKDFGDVLIKKSGVDQFDDGLGAFANRAFKKGEPIIFIV